jgi:hypothetical protein
MHMKNKYWALLLSALILQCTRAPLAGGGSDLPDTRTVAGRLYSANGAPAADAIVRLIPSTYDPVVDNLLPDSLSGATDEIGRYFLHVTGVGVFNILSYSALQRTRSFIAGVDVSTDSVEVRPDTLKTPGAIRVFLFPDLDTINGYVYLPGTFFWARLRNGTATIDSVPAGLIPAICYANSKDSTKNRVVRTNFRISSGETAIIADFSSWNYSKKIYLNTTPSGAGITGLVTDFPALVRLTSSNFDFSQAQSDGSDLRFGKPDNTPQPFEIERWDSAAQKAEIWVKLDTVYGNDSTHFITMYWGGPAAGSTGSPQGSAIVSLSNGAAVFDTANGFQGVWHLDEDPVNVSNSIKDQTAHGYNGTPHGAMTGLSSVDGIAGKAESFDGIDDYIVIPRPIQDDFTIGFWMKADTNSPTATQWWGGDGLVDGDVGQKQDADFGVTYLNNRPAFGTCCNDTTLEADVTVNDAQWHNVVVTRDKANGAKAIYVDGRLSGTQTGTTLSLTGPDSLGIGKVLANTTAFRGNLDEIQISGVVRSADWIKLSYMSQKAVGALVTIK